MSSPDIITIAPQHHNIMISSSPPLQEETCSQYGSGVLFPWKLHEMLEAADTKGFSSVVSWLPDRQSFKVHDKETFVSLIMSRYFEQTKYKSFQRQLNMWGFKRHLDGESKGAYSHTCLVRGKPSLCCRMKRSKRAGASVTSSTSSTSNKSISAAAVKRSRKSSLPRPVPARVGSKLPMTTLESGCSVISVDDESSTVSIESMMQQIVDLDQVQPIEGGEHEYPQMVDLAPQEYDCYNKPSLYESVMSIIAEPEQAAAADIFEGKRFFPVADDVVSDCW